MKKVSVRVIPSGLARRGLRRNGDFVFPVIARPQLLDDQPRRRKGSSTTSTTVIRLGSADRPTHSMRYNSAFCMARWRRLRIRLYPSTSESKISRLAKAMRSTRAFFAPRHQERQSQRRQDGIRNSKASNCSWIGPARSSRTRRRAVSITAAAAQGLVELGEGLHRRPGGASGPPPAPSTRPSGTTRRLAAWLPGLARCVPPARGNSWFAASPRGAPP